MNVYYRSGRRQTTKSSWNSTKLSGKSSWNSALLSGKLCGFGTLHKVRSIKAHVLSCLPWFKWTTKSSWHSALLSGQEQRGFLRCLLNTHNECAMHVHNHPQVVAHNFTHEYIRVCCVLWGFPYTDAIIDYFFPLNPTYPHVLYELKISYLLINYTLT